MTTSAADAIEAAPMLDYEDAPLRPFHIRVAIASTGGVFSDGFGLGIIGIALGAASGLDLTPLWLGLLGGASLAGLFAGALVTGPIADRFGRRRIFASNMIVVAIAAALQFFVTSTAELLVLRLAIGFVLGTDYVVSKTLLTEFTPRNYRGPVMSALSVAWAAGYLTAYFVGFVLIGSGPDAWRWMLVTGAVPALVILPLRITMPESPLWLANRGRGAEALRIVRAKIGLNVAAPVRGLAPARRGGQWRQLMAPAWRRRTLVGCALFTCQVIPYFALGTFVASVMTALNVRGAYVGGLVYNLFLLLGAILGLVISDRLPRRVFVNGSFAVTALTMLPLSLWSGWSPAVVIVLFAIFAGGLSAASNLVYVYLPELYPTELRASGIGLAVASSRIGSAISTFLLPIVVADFGVRVALGACVAVLALGGILCYLWAPETRHVRLGVIAGEA